MEELSMSEVDVAAALAKGLAVYEVMGAEGDIKTTWDPNNADEVEEQRRMFERLTKDKKMRAYDVTDDGKPGEPMDTFRAASGRVIFRPQMRGG